MGRSGFIQPFRTHSLIMRFAMKSKDSAMQSPRPILMLAAAAALATTVGACTPTVRLQVDPIQIYAKLDADVRVTLDRELQQVLQENPNLF